jgi:phosphatidylglycerophosphate synthase
MGLPVAAAGGLVLSGGAVGGMAVSVGLFALVTVLAFRSATRAYPHDRLGLCNTVTLMRAALAAAVAAPLAVPGVLTAQPALAWAVLAVATVALALDGVDGWLARRSGLSSEFGARFDMEVDALLALILAALALSTGKVGPWVLALGSMRYAFVAAGLLLPWLNAPLPQRFRRKLVCVVQIAVLIALLAPVVTPAVAGLLAAAATLMLAWSFAADVLWLARRR